MYQKIYCACTRKIEFSKVKVKLFIDHLNWRKFKSKLFELENRQKQKNWKNKKNQLSWSRFRISEKLKMTEAEGSNVYAIATAASSFAMLACYYVFNVAQKPKIVTSNKGLLSFLDEYLPSLKDKYWPSWFSWEGRIQSALGLSLRISSKEKLPYRRQIIELKDGGQLGLDFLGEHNMDDEKCDERLIVFLLPGLTSSSQTSYVKSLAMCIVNAGATVAVFNNRGLGGVPLKTPRTYCAANSEDVRECIAHLKEKFPGTKMMAVGTSLGGMTLSRYLINYPEEAKETFVAAMVISICWDPMIGTASLEKPFVNKYIVNYTLTQNLQHLAAMNMKVLESRDCWDFTKVLSSKTLREFDNHFTAPQFGYESYAEYYKAATITSEIHKFSIPVIGLNAEDDPMQPGEDLPTNEALAPDSMLAMIVTSRGGHLGFLEGATPFKRPFHYMERVVNEFVTAIRLHSDDLIEKLKLHKAAEKKILAQTEAQITTT